MKKVLLVDDMKTVRLYTRQILEAAGGFEIHEASNGVEGLEKALESSFDLLLVDVNMPKMDGYTMVGELRKDPSTLAIPIIMISTESKKMDREKAYQVGANYYLVKPVAPDVLRIVSQLAVGAVP